MKKTYPDSWFEVVPSTHLNREMLYMDKKVEVIQIENTNIMTDDGLLVICEIREKEEVA